MESIDVGHKYKLKTIQGNDVVLQFYKDEKHNGGCGCDGVISQEVLRALLDRQKFLDAQKECKQNKKIIKYLRKALIQFEIRHLERLVEKDLPIEIITVVENAHFVPKAKTLAQGANNE